MVYLYDTHLILECQRIGQYSDAIILQMDGHIYGVRRASIRKFHARKPQG
jgi:hypothetical protein